MGALDMPGNALACQGIQPPTKEPLALAPFERPHGAPMQAIKAPMGLSPHRQGPHAGHPDLIQIVSSGQPHEAQTEDEQTSQEDGTSRRREEETLQQQTFCFQTHCVRV